MNTQTTGKETVLDEEACLKACEHIAETQRLQQKFREKWKEAGYDFEAALQKIRDESYIAMMVERCSQL